MSCESARSSKDWTYSSEREYGDAATARRVQQEGTWAAGARLVRFGRQVDGTQSQSPSAVAAPAKTSKGVDAAFRAQRSPDDWIDQAGATGSVWLAGISSSPSQRDLISSFLSSSPLLQPTPIAQPPSLPH